MGIALVRELEDGEDDAILYMEDDGITKKRKSHDTFSGLFSTDNLELKMEIDELCHEEEDMLNFKNEEDEDERDVDGNVAAGSSHNRTTTCNNIAPVKTSSSETVIELLDEDECTRPLSISQLRELYRESGVMGTRSIGPHVQFNNLRIYTLSCPGPTYGLVMVQCSGRIIVKSHQPENSKDIARIGSILVSVNGHLIP